MSFATQDPPTSASTSPFLQPSFLAQLKLSLGIKYQKLLDDWTPYIKSRWFFTSFLSVLYVLRVYYLSGWYIISYALAIYLLNLLIGFLSPQVDPENEPSLPTRSDDEFRPFVRRLPEFKFWYAATRAFLIALLCTFFEVLNIPVFWPILLVYFIVLFAITMKKQILHMIKHKYIPFSIGKPKFKGGYHNSSGGKAGPEQKSSK